MGRRQLAGQLAVTPDNVQPTVWPTVIRIKTIHAHTLRVNPHPDMIARVLSTHSANLDLCPALPQQSGCGVRVAFNFYIQTLPTQPTLAWPNSWGTAPSFRQYRLLNRRPGQKKVYNHIARHHIPNDSNNHSLWHPHPYESLRHLKTTPRKFIRTHHLPHLHIAHWPMLLRHTCNQQAAANSKQSTINAGCIHRMLTRLTC